MRNVMASPFDPDDSLLEVFVGCEIAALLNALYLCDRIANMLRIDLPVLAHRSTASFRIASRRWGFSKIVLAAGMAHWLDRRFAGAA
jgi:hypothetical protein